MRIPADEDLSIDGFMQFRAVMLDATKYPAIAKILAKSAAQNNQDPAVKAQFENSVIQLLTMFAEGGYSRVAEVIDASVPEAQRETAARTYIKMVNLAAYEAYNMGLAENKKATLTNNKESQTLVQESLNAFSDMFFFGSPYFMQLSNFEHKEASGLQLTKSPGQKWVYLGSVLLVIGIFAMMYIRERRIWLLIKPQQNQVLFAMSSNRKNLDFEEEFNVYQNQLNTVLN